MKFSNDISLDQDFLSTLPLVKAQRDGVIYDYFTAGISNGEINLINTKDRKSEFIIDIKHLFKENELGVIVNARPYAKALKDSLITQELDNYQHNKFY
jgi:hypothetical protein